MKFIFCSIFSFLCSSPKIEAPEIVQGKLTLTPIAKLGINIEAENYNPEQLKKLDLARGLISSILNSKEFRDAVISNGAYTNNRKMINEEIYASLMLGKELSLIDSVGSMDVKVKMYYSNNKVVGYTYANSTTLYTNSKFHNTYPPCSVAKNIVHEWTHMLGFTHSSSKDSKSVPYRVGDIVNDLCERL